jgi:uncharacterized cupredoxin-like copper-binding protein
LIDLGCRGQGATSTWPRIFFWNNIQKYYSLFESKDSTMNRIIFIVMFAFTLTSCISSTNTATLDGPSQATLNVKVTGQGYDSSTYVVPAGADVTVHFTNDAPLPHIFAVLKQDEHVTPPFQPKDEEKIMWKITAQTGETRSDIFKAPTKPGKYDIVCPFPGHIEYGMTATLVVEDEKK